MGNGPNEGLEPADLQALLRDSGGDVDLSGRLADALRWPVDCDAARWSARVLSSASPVLEERARRVWRRQMSSVLIAALATLPVWLFASAYLFEVAYELLCGLLPAAVATYLISTYAVMALGVVGATYAMIPVVIGRSRDRLAFAQTWEIAR